MSDDSCLDAASGSSPVKLVSWLDWCQTCGVSRCGVMAWGATRPGCGPRRGAVSGTGGGGHTSLHDFQGVGEVSGGGGGPRHSRPTGD